MSRFWIFQDCHYAQASEFSGLHRFAYFRKYDKILSSVEMQLRKGSKYSRIANMSGFCRCKHYTRCWICLNMDEECLNKLFWQWRGYEYAWSKLHRVLNMALVLNTLSVKKKMVKSGHFLVVTNIFPWPIPLLFFLLNKNQMTEILKKYQIFYIIIRLSGIG